MEILEQVKNFFSEHDSLKNYEVRNVTIDSTSDSLAVVMAYNKVKDNFTVWSAYDLNSDSLNHGHYDLTESEAFTYLGILSGTDEMLKSYLRDNGYAIYRKFHLNFCKEDCIQYINDTRGSFLSYEDITDPRLKSVIDEMAIEYDEKYSSGANGSWFEDMGNAYQNFVEELDELIPTDFDNTEIEL